MDTFIFGIIVFALYFLPTIIGWNHRNINSIGMLNLFLGWTLIGWVVAIIWAVSNDSKREIIINTKSKSDDLITLKELLDDGTLTQEEFNEEKKRLLRN